MPPKVTGQSFAREWRRFLFALRRDAKRLARQRNAKAFQSHFVPLMSDVFEQLLSEKALKAIQQAVDAELTDPDSSESIEFLQRELIFYSEWRKPKRLTSIAGASTEDSAADDLGDEDDEVDSTGGSKDNDEADDDNDAVGAGKTIKDSAEGLIKKLPKWLRNLLKILNELLSIVRGGD